MRVAMILSGSAVGVFVGMNIAIQHIQSLEKRANEDLEELKTMINKYREYRDVYNPSDASTFDIRQYYVKLVEEIGCNIQSVEEWKQLQWYSKLFTHRPGLGTMVNNAEHVAAVYSRM